MSSQTAMSLICSVEFALWVALGFLFWKKKLYSRFPAMGAYLALCIVLAPALLVFLLYGGLLASQHIFHAIYYYLYWGVYLSSVVLLYFVCLEVFRSALSPFPGLQRLGTVIFRWAVLASIIVSLSTISLEHLSVLTITEIAYKLMRSVSIIELCLLAFLCLSMNALHLSIRDLNFGIALGFGAMASNDFVCASLMSRYTSLTDPLQFFSEAVILVALGVWVTYCALPEPVRKPVTVPINSTIYRWDQIASALGHTGTQVAVQQPASGFFLTDVENVVEKVLARNLKKRESET